MNTWKAILAALVIFGAGLVTGAVWMNVSKPAAPKVDPVAAKPPGPRQATPLQLEHLRKVELMMRVQKELDLTPEQRERVQKYIGDAQERVGDLWDQVAPEMYAELQDLKKKICDELTPEQNKRFNELMKHQSKNKSSSSSSSSSASSTNAPVKATE